MKTLLYAGIVIVLCILLVSLVLLWYRPKMPSQSLSIRPIEQEEEKDRTIYYAQKCSTFQRRFQTTVGLFSTEIFPNGLLFHYLGQTKENGHLCLYFHDEKKYLLAMQEIEELIAQNNSFRTDLTICYCEGKSAAFSHQLEEYFHEHAMRFDLILHDLTGLYEYAGIKRTVARLGVIRKIHVRLQNQSDHPFDQSQLMFPSSLWKPMYRQLKGYLPKRLRMQIANPITRATGVYHLFEMDEQIRRDFFASICSIEDRIEITCETEQGKENCLSEVHRQNISYKLLQESEGGIDDTNDDVLTSLRACIAQAYQNVTVVDMMYDNDTDVVLERFASHCYSFCPQTEIQSSRLAGMMFYQNLLRG